MNTPKHLLFVLLGFLTSCASMEFRSEFKPTAALIEDVRTKCEVHMKNEPLAQKECFPLLKDKPILIEVQEVSSSYGRLSVNGAAGPDRNRIWCEVDEKTRAKILKDPTYVSVKERYWVKGDFTRLSLGGLLDFYTLSNCSVEKYQPPTKAGA